MILEPHASTLTWQDGVTRDTVISLASRLGHKVVERRMTRDDIYAADEVFLTGTAVDITPVREVDGRSIGSGSVSTFTAKMQAMFAELVRGRSADEREWLTRI